MPVYTLRPMCSTKEPKVRRLTGATTKAGSTWSEVLIILILLLLVDAGGRVAEDRRGMGLGRASGPGWPVRSRVRPRSVRSALEAGSGDALDDVPLEEQEHQHQRKAAEQGRRHEVGVADAVGALHRREADLDRHEVRVGQDEQRPQEVVPRP